MTEITPSLIYWITRFDDIKSYGGLIFTVSGMALVISIMTLIFLKLGNAKGGNNYETSIVGKCFILISLIFLISSMSILFIPTTRQACAMYVVPKIANNEKAQDIGKEFYDLALDWMKELHPKSQKITILSKKEKQP